MRRHRSGAREVYPILCLVHDEPGAARHILSHGARITHAPVETDTVPIDPIACLVEGFPYLAVSSPALGGFAKADLSMHHDAPLLCTPSLVIRLASDAEGLQKGRPPNRDLLRHVAAFLDKGR